MAWKFNPITGTLNEVGGSSSSVGGAMVNHIIPDANNVWDIGSAEYKIRDLYINNNSIHTESGKSMSFEGGNLTWGGDEVIMLSDLKIMVTEATSFEEFKSAILNL